MVRLGLVLVSLIVWFVCGRPLVSIPGLGEFSVYGVAEKLVPAMKISMVLIILCALLGSRAFLNFAFGGFMAFFTAAGLRAVERMDRLLLEDDESIRSAIAGLKVLPLAGILAIIMALQICLVLKWNVKPRPLTNTERL
jgi:hypothetical protein